MGPWFVLVSPCFRENVVATCKIGSFLCSLDNLLQKNVIVLFFFFLEIKYQNGTHLKKGLLLTYLSHFLVTREKLQKFLQHIRDLFSQNERQVSRELKEICDPSHHNRAVVGRMHFKILLRLYGKKQRKEKEIRLIFDHKIAMLHPIYT